jgi:alginate O-acetyltransferase complex protein AlgI
MVFFRSSTMHAAVDILRGMIGLNGVQLPSTVLAKLGPIASWLQRLGVGVGPGELFPFAKMMFWLAALAVLVFFSPNTLQIMARYDPAVGFKVSATEAAGFLRRIRWTPSVAWAVAVSVAAAIGILQLSGPSEFLYWQF